MLTAPLLYSKSQGAKNATGQYQCHWCGGSCGSFFQHDDIMSRDIGVPFSRNGAKCPGNPYVCTGCWLWQRKRITVHFIHPEPFTSGMPLGQGPHLTLKDGQAPRNHSWWITELGAWSITPNNGPAISKLLLKPPLKFALMLLDGAGSVNHLHKGTANDLPKILADTPLKFTVNNIVHTYTVYELEQIMKSGPVGKEPGVQFLFRLLKLQPTELDNNDDDIACVEKTAASKNSVGRPILQKVADYKRKINSV